MAFYSCLVIWDSHSPYSPAFVFMAGDYKLYGRWQKNEWISLKYHFNHTNNEWLFKVWIWCALLINMNVITIKRLKVELQIPSEDFVYYYYLAISCCRSLVMILKIYILDSLLARGLNQLSPGVFELFRSIIHQMLHVSTRRPVHVDPKILGPQISMSAPKPKNNLINSVAYFDCLNNVLLLVITTKLAGSVHRIHKLNNQPLFGWYFYLYMYNLQGIGSMFYPNTV